MGGRRQPSLLVTRPRLEKILDRALGHRLALVVADAGFGKTTLLTAWTSGIRAALHDITPADNDLARFARSVVDALRLRIPELSNDVAGVVDTGHVPEISGEQRARPDAIAELLGSALEQHMRRDVVLVLDNAHLLDTEPATRFLAGLIRHAPPLLHVVLACRSMPAIPVERLRDHGDVIELHGDQLDFTVDEVARLLTAAVGEDAAELAKPIHDATAGWPSAVRLAVEAIREVAPAARSRYVASLAGENGEISQLAEHVYEQEPAAVKHLLAVIALFDEVTVGMLAAIGLDAAEQVATLLRRGLFLEPGASGANWFRLHTIASDAVARHGRVPDEDAAALRIAAAQWLMDNNLPYQALRALVGAGSQLDIVALFAHSGQHLLNHGHADDVITAVATLPPHLRETHVERLAGEAHQLRGEWDSALACYRNAAHDDEALEAGLAWRMGVIHYLRGELDEAVNVYRRGRVGEHATRDSALLLAWQASAYWMRGETEDCGALAVRAMRAATQVDDAQALAAAHTVLAMLAALEGDRRANDAHYLKALHYAERAGDVLQLVRIHNNRGSHYLEEGAYHEALAELDIAIRLADLSGFAAFGALALCNRGEAQRGLGRLEEALSDFTASVTAFDNLRSALVANPLRELGELHRLRGDVPAAKAAFERAVTLATEAGDAQAMAPALAGLAMILAEEDPDRAAALAERAVETGTAIGVVGAMLAAGWVALAKGDAATAHKRADAAGSTARDRRDVPGEAEAATLAAAATEDDVEALAKAEHALRLWTRSADPIGMDLAEIVRAERLSAAAALPALAAVRERMRAMGCRLLDTRAAAAQARFTPPEESAVRLETLGGFRLVRDGQVVAHNAWKSRKARELLKILISLRGRPAAHEMLTELLWPGQRFSDIGNGLNVLVSTVRSLLDPGRRAGPDGFVTNDGSALRLNLDYLEIDVEFFLADATAGFRLMRDGRYEDAVELLLRAESRYAGDFLEEDLYVDWAAPLREEARLAYRQVTAHLAHHARSRGDSDGTVRYLMRSLARDPYDETTHLELVLALSSFGRHGDARRYYRGYCGRMEELGIEAAPFPAA